MGTTKGKWTNGVLTYYDSTTYEERPAGPLALFYDDFLTGSVVIPAAGAAESGSDWVKKITGAAPPTVAILAGAASEVGCNGQVQCAMTADSQKQEAGIYFNDQRPFTLNHGLIFEARIRASVLPTGNGEMWIGLGGNYVEGTIVTDGPAEHMFFVLDGSGAVVMYSDDGTIDVDATSSGVTLTATDWAVLRIDCTSASSIKWYINGAQVGSATTHSMATTATLHLQPYIWCHKESGTGLGTLLCDYVKVWQKRTSL